MATSGRAAAPYPPIITEFDGSTSNLRPASVVNLTPVTVGWKKRDRLKTTITFPSAADEAVEAGTEYVARFGPPGFTEEIVLGDHTATDGSFNYSFSGSNPTEIFARIDGHESSLYKFTTNVLNASGGSAAGDIGTVNRTEIPVPHFQIIWEGKIGTVKVTGPQPIPMFPGDASGLLKTLNLSVADGFATGENITGRSWFGTGSAVDVGSTTVYFPVSGSMSNASEAQNETRAKSYWMAGRITNPTVVVSANTRTTALVANLRKNGVTIGTITVPPATTGSFTGNFAVDTAAGDSLTWQMIGGGSGAATVKACTVEFDNGDEHARSLWMKCDSYTVGFVSNGTRYMGFNGGIGSFATIASSEGTGTSEASIQWPSVAKNFGVGIYTNTFSADIVATLRKNGADTAVTVTIPAGQSGLFVNTTDSLNLIAGDYLTIKWVFPTGTGSGTIVSTFVWIESSDDHFTIINQAGNQQLNYNVDLYRPLIGAQGPSTAAETAQRLTVSRRYAATLLTTAVGLNNAAAKDDYLMVNGVDSAMTLHISGTGKFVDSAHTVTLQTGDQIDYHWGQNNNSMTYSFTAMLLKPLNEVFNSYGSGAIGTISAISAPQASVTVTYVGDGALRVAEEYIEIINEGSGVSNLRVAEEYLEVIYDGSGVSDLRVAELYIEVIEDQ